MQHSLITLIAMISLTSCTQESTTMTPSPAPQTSASTSIPQSLHQFETRTLEGARVSLSEYGGKVALVVNVASECGLTPQYEGLQSLHDEFGPRGFTVLAFPCNDFGGQEPGTPAEIRHFCTSNYHVTFPVFEKVQTLDGPGQSPVYGFLGAKAGALPEWNFGKYLVGRDGRVLGFFGPKVSPADPGLRKAIDEAVAGAH